MAITQAPKFERGDLVRFKPDSKAPRELRNLGSLWVDAVEYNGEYELLFHDGRRCYAKEHELDLVKAADPAPTRGPWGAMHDEASKPEAPSDNLTEAGWAFDLYDDRGFLDHNDVAGTIDDLNRIANGRAIRLRGKVAPGPGQMRLMLEACRDQFNFYADNHEAKGTPESLVKANANRLYAARITAVLRGGEA